MNSDKKNRGIIVFLLLSLVAIGILSFQNARDYSKLQTAFFEEKKELESELDKIITDYDSAITKKINVSVKLRKERNRVIQLRDSIRSLQENNYSLIRKFRKRISKLEKQNKVLFAKVDSLNEQNTFLQVENIAVREELSAKDKLSNKLAQTNKQLKKSRENLETKIAIAQELEVNDLTVVPLKKRSSGKYTSTSRARKVEAFKVSFDILKNELATEGERKVYIQLLDMDKNIISADGYKHLKNGKKLVYSDVFSADYHNKEISLVNLIEVEKGHIKKGDYIVNLFLEGKLVKSSTIKL